MAKKPTKPKTFTVPKIVYALAEDAGAKQYADVRGYKDLQEVVYGNEPVQVAIYELVEIRTYRMDSKIVEVE